MHPDLKIKIPHAQRKQKQPLEGYAPEYWDLVRKHGKSRKAMVDFICGIGGYSDRRDCWAIEFNISADRVDLTQEHLWELLSSGKMDVGPDDTYSPEKLLQVKALFWKVYAEHEEALWSWAVEEAYESWKDSDTPYETFTGERINWKWEIQGRGGKHLCMTECDGDSLECSTDDLESDLRPTGKDTVWSHAEVRKLFIICVQNSVDLTPKRISEEVEYRAAWRLWVSFCEGEIERVTERVNEQMRLSQLAGEIIQVLTDSTAGDENEHSRTFRAICKIAEIHV